LEETAPPEHLKWDRDDIESQIQEQTGGIQTDPDKKSTLNGSAEGEDKNSSGSEKKGLGHKHTGKTTKKNAWGKSREGKAKRALKKKRGKPGKGGMETPLQTKGGP